MPTFTVHEPRPRKNETAPNPERFVFVRDGFYFWAFVLAPLWLLVHRLWIVFVLYLVLNTVIGVALFFLHAPHGVEMLVGGLIAVLVGFEAGTLWRWTLARRKWKTLGFVVADSVEQAEQRFFSDWVKRADTALPETPPPAEPLYAPPVRRGPPSGSDVIGLFPEPGK